MPHRIIYIEDNAGDYELITEAFREIGSDARFEWVQDGIAALAVLDGIASGDQLPALLLIDVNLTKLDGIVVLQHAKTKELLAKVPAVMLTSSTSHLDRQRCGAADGYFAKCARWKDTLALVRKLRAIAEQTSSN